MKKWKNYFLLAKAEERLTEARVSVKKMLSAIAFLNRKTESRSPTTIYKRVHAAIWRSF